MKNRRVELTAGRKNLPVFKIPRVIFQGDPPSPLLFVIAIMPFNYIIEKYTGGYKLHKSRENINHQLYINNIKLFAKKSIGKPNISCQDKQHTGMKFDIEKCDMI